MEHLAGEAEGGNPPSALPAVGSVFGESYRIEGTLGRGGHGAVLRATDLRDGKPVALKLLLPEHLDAVGRDRFRREASLAERLRSPHSVRLHAHGEDARGQPFIAFELLNGISLSQHLRKRGALEPGRVAEVASAVLEALAEAHALGMVHRDIKPANIHLCQYAGSSDYIKVLDFGIAKRSASDATQLTSADVVVGTARYIAPEQLRGTEISPATDLYSLGLVMAEMLSAEPVFQGSTMEICLEQVSANRVPLSDAVRSSALGAVIEQATRKRPSERYQDAVQMLAALRPVRSPPEVAAPESEEPTLFTTPDLAAADPTQLLFPGALAAAAPLAPAPPPPPAPPDVEPIAALPQHPSGGYPPVATPMASLPQHPSGGYPAVATPMASLPQHPSGGYPAVEVPISAAPYPVAVRPSIEVPFNGGTPGFQAPLGSAPPFPVPSTRELKRTPGAPPSRPLLWAIGILTLALLLGALIAASASLLSSPSNSDDAPPPLPTQRR
ncbi:MAG: protein kinase [Myxococcales bacterium]|nr:protein kinase [Myxococcales bacterium]